jgi:tRNA A37 threonylcarbamoyladenosine dehydratase
MDNTETSQLESVIISVPNIQVKHFNHLFRIYIKSIGKHKVCRVEESFHPASKKCAIEAISDIFNPAESEVVKSYVKCT